MLIVLPLFFKLCSPSSSLVLQANYKLWAPSTKYLYDYYKSASVQISSTVSCPIVSTDRDMYISNVWALFLPSNNLASSPATQDSVISIWVYFYTSGRIFHVKDLRISSNFDPSNSTIITHSREDNPGIVITYNTPSSNLYGARWRFLVVRF